MTATLSVSKIANVTAEAHKAAYAALALFGNHHKFKQGYQEKKDYFSTTNGYQNYMLDFIPVSRMIKGGVIREQGPMRPITATSLWQLFKGSFAAGKAWAVDDTQVKTNDLMDEICMFLNMNREHFEVFAGVYENKHTYTNVFGVYVSLKDVSGSDRLTWEITIDDVDLVTPDTMRSLFRR